jgi:CubicO group peptidase (beta-lactamase class C family)
MFLGHGKLGEVRVLSPATVRAMTTNQLAFMPKVPELERRCRPWGLGWRIQSPADSGGFGDLLSEQTFGHWGATGTLAWCDPIRDACAVILTTQPLDADNRLHVRLSNALVAAIN